VGWFGYYGYPNSARPWQNKQLWDWSRCCSMDVTNNKFFGLVSALFGYTVSHQPQTPLPVDSNLFAFFLFGCIFIKREREGTLCT
jgi:hypothetical protein